METFAFSPRDGLNDQYHLHIRLLNRNFADFPPALYHYNVGSLCNWTNMTWNSWIEWRASHQNQIRILLPHRQKHISACCLAAIAAGSGRHIIYFLFLASKVFIITFQFNFNLLFVTSWPLTYFLVSKQTLCHSLGFKCVTFHFLSLSVSPSFFCVHQWLIG